MSAVIWPFVPRMEVIEVLEWATDVLRAKTAEQRIAMRTTPRRTFVLNHLLTDYQYSNATALIREAQAGDGFLVPDWSQAIDIAAVSAGSNVLISSDLSDIDMGDYVLLRESDTKFEQVSITNDSSGATLATVLTNYSQAQIIPLWPCEAPEGLNSSRSAGRINQATISMVVSESSYLSLTPNTTYRSLDVLDECPVVAGSEFTEVTVWENTAFENITSVAHYIRQRSTPDVTYNMRWSLYSQSEKYALRQWLYYRKGRQRAFWMSSRSKDFELAATIGSSSTTVKVFSFPGLTGVGRTTAFDIEIKTPAASYYRQVTALAIGTPVSGRPTLDMTINTSTGTAISVNNYTRISFLRCSRFNADRIELLHKAGEGMTVQVPCIEIPIP